MAILKVNLNTSPVIIELDGKDISGMISGLNINSRPDKTEATIMITGEIKFEGESSVYIEDSNGTKINLASYMKVMK
jgi:hypothetical protein